MDLSLLLVFKGHWGCCLIYCCPMLTSSGPCSDCTKTNPAAHGGGVTCAPFKLWALRDFWTEQKNNALTRLFSGILAPILADEIKIAPQASSVSLWMHKQLYKNLFLLLSLERQWAHSDRSQESPFCYVMLENSHQMRSSAAFGFSLQAPAPRWSFFLCGS